MRKIRSTGRSEIRIEANLYASCKSPHCEGNQVMTFRTLLPKNRYIPLRPDRIGYLFCIRGSDEQEPGF